MPRLLATLAACLLCLAPAASASTLLALDKSEGGRLHVIDLESFTLRHSVQVGHHPHEVIASRDGRSAWVALYGDAQNVGHHLVEVDLASGEVARTIDTLPLQRPHGMSRAGDNIYFTAELNRAVARLNPAEGRIDRIYGIGRNGIHMIETAPDGQQLFTTDIASNSVSHLDFRSPSPVPKLTHYEVGDKPEGLALHPDGRQAWVGLNGEGKIRILDLDSGEIVATLAAGSYPARIEFSSDGRLAFAIDPMHSAILVFDVAARELRHSHRVEGLPHGIQPASDPRRLFLTLVQAGEVVELDVDSGQVLRRLAVGSVADGVALASAG